MEIKESSWHFKVFEKSDYWDTCMFKGRKPNLCRYFWTVVGKIIRYAIIAIGVPGSFIIPHWLLYINEPTSFFILLMIYALATIGAIISLYSIKGYREVRYMWYLNFPKKVKVKRETTFTKVIINFLKAKKDKICPLIDIVE